MITFYATSKFPSSGCSYDVQIWSRSFAHCLKHLFVPPCTDPKMRLHIQESDVQVTYRLNVWYYYYSFLVFALRNIVPSRTFSQRICLDPPNLIRCVRLLVNIYYFSLLLGCDMVRFDVLCCDVMWYGVMWCDVLRCVVIWCDVMCCVVMWCDMVWCDMLWCDVICCDVLFCNMLWCDVMCCIVICCDAMCSDVMCCDMLWFDVL